MAAGGQPAKRAPRKRAPAKKAAPKQPAPASATSPAAEVPLNQWVHELNRPLRIEVFDRWWEFKQPTGGRAARWDQLSRVSMADALASMMFDETPAPPVEQRAEDGTVTTLERPPGSARANEFVDLAVEWVPPADAAAFWLRVEKALFGLGEPSAS